MNRDSVIQITVLKGKLAPQTLIIANTHMLFNMKRGEIKLGHAMIMLRAIEKIREFCGKGLWLLSSNS
jgi:hypothetical protein